MFQMPNSKAAPPTFPIQMAHIKDFKAQYCTHWVAALQNLGVCDARVGHVCVHARAAVPAGARARAAADRLVVPQLRVAKRQVVRAALQCSSNWFAVEFAGAVISLISQYHS